VEKQQQPAVQRNVGVIKAFAVPQEVIDKEKRIEELRRKEKGSKKNKKKIKEEKEKRSSLEVRADERKASLQRARSMTEAPEVPLLPPISPGDGLDDIIKTKPGTGDVPLFFGRA